MKLLNRCIEKAQIYGIWLIAKLYVGVTTQQQQKININLKFYDQLFMLSIKFTAFINKLWNIKLGWSGKLLIVSDVRQKLGFLENTNLIPCT